MSMSIWIGIRRPLPTPGTPLDLPLPPGTLSATASLAFSAMFETAAEPSPETLLTSLPAPLTAIGASAANPTPAATPGETGDPFERFRALLDSDFAVSRVTFPMAVPTVSVTSSVICASPTSGVPLPGCVPEQRATGNREIALGGAERRPNAAGRKGVYPGLAPELG